MRDAISLVAIMKAIQAFTAPKAHRSMHGTWTYPATGSQVIPEMVFEAPTRRRSRAPGANCPWPGRGTRPTWQRRRRSRTDIHPRPRKRGVVLAQVPDGRAGKQTLSGLLRGNLRLLSIEGIDDRGHDARRAARGRRDHQVTAGVLLRSRQCARGDKRDGPVAFVLFVHGALVDRRRLGVQLDGSRKDPFLDGEPGFDGRQHRADDLVEERVDLLLASCRTPPVSFAMMTWAIDRLFCSACAAAPSSSRRDTSAGLSSAAGSPSIR